MPQTDPVELVLQKLKAQERNGTADEEFPFRSPPTTLRSSVTHTLDAAERSDLNLFEKYEKAGKPDLDKAMDLHKDMLRRGHKRATTASKEKKEEEVRWIRVHSKNEKKLRDFNRTCDMMYALTRVLGLGIIGCEGFLTNARGSIYERMSPKKQSELKARIIADSLRFPSTVYDGQFEEYLGVRPGVDFWYEDFYNEHIRQAGETESTPTQNEPMETEEVPERMETEEVPERRFCSICQYSIETSEEELITLPCLHEYHTICWGAWPGGICCVCRKTVDGAAQAFWEEELLDHHFETHFNDYVVATLPIANEVTPPRQAATRTGRGRRIWPRPEGISDAEWEVLQDRRAQGRERAARRRAAACPDN
ncbi:hypothetical protein HK104_006622 [Borealophlyctis nickersoniae]|nr:hypothetical protein HK104_006622 [Borealophlyctis nickersoniae]